MVSEAHNLSFPPQNVVKAHCFCAGGNPVTGIAYDWIGENIYYTNGDHVGACARNGENCTVLLKDPRNPPLRIALDPKFG